MKREGDRVKEIRIILGVKQKDFATRLGITGASLSRIEANLQRLTDAMIRLICALYNVNEDWIRTGSGEMFKSVKEDIPGLSDLLDIYDALDPMSRRMILDYAQYLLDAKNQQSILRERPETAQETSPEPESVAALTSKNRA
jgi:transcriptional regulator with XRE-family HTH domain